MEGAVLSKIVKELLITSNALPAESETRMKQSSERVQGIVQMKAPSFSVFNAIDV